MKNVGSSQTVKFAFALAALLFHSKALSVVPPNNWSISDYAQFQTDCIVGSARLLNPTDLTPGGDRCDAYAADRYERPTSSDGSVYYGEIDIDRVGVGLNNIWFFYMIDLVSTDQNGDLGASYGYEIDFDNDNRGDFYVRIIDASAPEIVAGWSQKDLTMWTDTDNDVGGVNPLVANDKTASQDGYDTEKFPVNLEPGTGGNAGDGVWARVSPTDPTVVEVAIKQTFVGNPATAGSLRGWSTKGNQSENQFYFHDYYTNSELGDAYPDEPNFPPGNFQMGDNSNGLGEGLSVILVGVEVTAPTVSGLVCWGEQIVYSDLSVKNSAAGGTDTINISLSSTETLLIELLSQDGTTLLARDDQGDGVWDFLATGVDTDGNGQPDTGDIAGGVELLYQLRLTVPYPSVNAIANTTITGTSLKKSTVRDSLTFNTTLKECLPNVVVNKSSIAYLDPINGSTNPKRIPGGTILYTLDVSNSGDGKTNADTVVIYDPLPSELELYVADFDPAAGPPVVGPAKFSDGTPSSGLSYTFISLSDITDSISFSSNNGADNYTYVPIPNGDGYDPMVTDLRIDLTGVFVEQAGSVAPSFEIQFKTRIR